MFDGRRMRNRSQTNAGLQHFVDVRSLNPEPFKCSVRAKMAAQADWLRVKVGEEKVREDLNRFFQQRKKKKMKRDASPSADKRERSGKVKLYHHHHHHHAEHRSHQPQPNPQPRNFMAGNPVLHTRIHHTPSPTSGFKKPLPPTLFPHPPPQLQKKRHLPAEPPALFTFTPLKVAKAKHQYAKETIKELKMKLKKENTEANVKHADHQKKKGAFCYLVHESRSLVGVWLE